MAIGEKTPTMTPTNRRISATRIPKMALVTEARRFFRSPLCTMTCSPSWKHSLSIHQSVWNMTKHFCDNVALFCSEIKHLEHMRFFGAQCHLEHPDPYRPSIDFMETVSLIYSSRACPTGPPGSCTGSTLASRTYQSYHH